MPFLPLLLTPFLKQPQTTSFMREPRGPLSAILLLPLLSLEEGFRVYERCSLPISSTMVFILVSSSRAKSRGHRAGFLLKPPDPDANLDTQKTWGQSGTCAKVYLALERFLEGHDIFNGLRQGLDAGSVLCYIVNVNGNDNVVAETGCRQA